jgi:hypothetical protein
LPNVVLKFSGSEIQPLDVLLRQSPRILPLLFVGSDHLLFFAFRKYSLCLCELIVKLAERLKGQRKLIVVVAMLRVEKTENVWSHQIACHLEHGCSEVTEGRL